MSTVARSTVGLAVLLVFGACFDGAASEIEPNPFLAERWIRYPAERGAMVDDLIANHLPAGMSRSEIESLLGISIQPAVAGGTQTQWKRHSAPGAGYVDDERELWGLDLGGCPGVTFGCYLNLEFDSVGRLVRASTGGY